MALDSMVIAGLAEELNRRLSGARVDKVTMPRKDRVILHLRAEEGNVRLLLCAGAGARMHLTEEKYDLPETPPMLCMLLRKQMAGGRIVSITQPGHERMLTLTFTAVDELGEITEKQLHCEMMGRMTNLILVNGAGIILACTHAVGYEQSERAVQPGLLYHLPPRQDKPLLWDLTEEELQSICRDCADDAGRLCGRIAGLSPLLAREVIFRGNTPEEVAQALLALRKSEPKPYLLRGADGKTDYSAWEIRQNLNTECISFDSFSALFDSFYAEQTKKDDLRALNGAMVKSMTTVRNRLRRKLAGQKEELLVASGREQLKRTADLITANLYAIHPGDRSVVLTDYYDPSLRQVKVELDPMLSPQENAQRLFHRYTRQKRAEEALTHQIELGEAELEYVEAVLYTLNAAPDAQQIREIREELIQGGYVRPTEKGRRKPKALAFHPLEYTVDGGFTVLCGRNNRENDELTHRKAAKNDLWFHARNVPGSHVILLTQGAEPSDLAIRQAAALAAFHSAAGKQPRAAVDFTQVRRVKKPQGARPGMVNYFQYQTVLAEPALPEPEKS